MSLEAFDADVIVVGAGPAGLSASLVLARACRTVLVFDHGRPRNAVTRHLHGFLTRDGTTPEEFRRLARAELARYDSVRIESAEVIESRVLDGSGFEVVLGDGRRFVSRKLLLATGVTDNVPDVPGLRDFYGSSVFHCPYCDGWDVRGQPLAVYGCSQRGYGLSLELTGWSRDIVLCSDGSCELDTPDVRRLEANGIAIREERIVRLEGRDGMLEQIVFASGPPLLRRAMFFTTGQRQCSDLARSLGCEFNEQGTVSTGRHETTHLPGLFVAGDASRDVQWVIVAAAEGAEAAYAINQDLIRQGLNG